MFRLASDADVHGEIIRGLRRRLPDDGRHHFLNLLFPLGLEELGGGVLSTAHKFLGVVDGHGLERTGEPSLSPNPRVLRVFLR